MSNPTHLNPTSRPGKIKLREPPVLRKAPAEQRGPLPEEQRHAMIAEAAYYLAERRGFEAGHELEDWLRAESQLAAAIRGGDLPAG